MSAQEIIQRLNAANQKLEQAHAKAMAAAKDAAEARALVATALQGSSGQLTGLLAQVQESFTEAAKRVAPARQRIQETITKTQALGN